MAGILTHTVPHHRKGQGPPNYVHNSVTSPRARHKEQLLRRESCPVPFLPNREPLGTCVCNELQGAPFRWELWE